MKHRLRLLQVCHDYKGPFKSICQQYVAGFADYEVTTVFLKGAPEKSVSESVGGHSVGYLQEGKRSLRGLKLGAIWRLSGLFKSQSFDLVIAHRHKAIYMVGILSLFYRIPLLLGVVHALRVFRPMARRFFVRRCCKTCLIAGVSQAVTDDNASYCPALVTSNRLLTLPNAIDVNKEVSILSRDESRAILGLGTEDSVIGSIGRLVDVKNFALLIEAFAQLPQRCRVKLLLIGTGPKRDLLQAQAEKLGVLADVIFVGHKPDAYRLVRAMDLFVLPSNQREAFGVVLLEAMLAKVSILCSDAPGPAEVVAGVGTLFRCGDLGHLSAQLQHCLATPDSARTATINAAYQRVCDRYSYKMFQSRVQEALNRLAS